MIEFVERISEIYFIKIHFNPVSHAMGTEGLKDPHLFPLPIAFFFQ